jgi:kynureninase
VSPRGAAGISWPGGAPPRDDASWAAAADAADELAPLRERFFIPPARDGRGEVAYFAGNSLGLQPKGVEQVIAQELEDWRRLAVEAHFEGRDPWFSYHEQFREPGARLVGARPGEVVMMNGLTVNLHLMLVSFYRPRGRRVRVLVEDGSFPSDLYAVRSRVTAWIPTRRCSWRRRGTARRRCGRKTSRR